MGVWCRHSYLLWSMQLTLAMLCVRESRLFLAHAVQVNCILLIKGQYLVHLLPYETPKKM